MDRRTGTWLAPGTSATSLRRQRIWLHKEGRGQWGWSVHYHPKCTQLCTPWYDFCFFCLRRIIQMKFFQLMVLCSLLCFVAEFLFVYTIYLLRGCVYSVFSFSLYLMNNKISESTLRTFKVTLVWWSFQIDCLSGISLLSFLLEPQNINSRYTEALPLQRETGRKSKEHLYVCRCVREAS